MSLKNLDKAPFPWFGGKSNAADLVWSLLGDVPHYVEPFFGSGAVLLNRPHPCNRPYSSETVNDLDGFVVNFWRSIQFAPEQTAIAASWPVTEADKTARQLSLLRWRNGALDRLAGDAMWHDAVMAGWWAWSVSVQIGAFDGKQGWTAGPATGKIYLQPRGKTREPGVHRNRQQLGNERGINHPGVREPGVSREFPLLATDGQGVNRPQARKPGVWRDRPDINDNGRGPNNAGLREPGVLDPAPTNADELRQLDVIDWGQNYHGLVMPELVRWFRHLAARLRHVRVVNGSWERVCTTGAAWTLPVRQGTGPAGVFLDPPYADTANRDPNLYAHESATVAHDVRRWCLENGDNPKFRIVLAGFEGEHGTELEDAGWKCHEWYKSGFLKGGMGNQSGKSQQHRERLWSSPHCVKPETKAVGGQRKLFCEEGST